MHDIELHIEMDVAQPENDLVDNRLRDPCNAGESKVIVWEIKRPKIPVEEDLLPEIPMDPLSPSLQEEDLEPDWKC